MKFAVLSDLHLGLELDYADLSVDSETYVKQVLAGFIHEMNTSVHPEFVVVLGDLIEDVDAVTDVRRMRYVLDTLSQLSCPVYCVAGNHDTVHIHNLSEIFGRKRLYYSFDSHTHHGVVLFSQVHTDGTSSISAEQRAWLAQDLKSTTKPTLVFVHHSLADQDVSGNPWFDGMPDKCLVANRQEVRKILSDSQKVVACINGHLHWDRYHVHDNIPYFTIQSAIENEDSQGVPSNTFGVITVDDRKVIVDIHGTYPKQFRHA